jgi:hypothetical protein
MRHPKTTLIGAASGLVLLAAIILPANAAPLLGPPTASTGLVELVKSGGGGGGGGGRSGGGGAARFGAFGGNGGMGMRSGSSGPHMGYSMAHMGEHNMGHIARSGDFNGRVARGGDFDGNVGRHERSYANNWNGNWNGNHHHHGYYNRFYAYPFFYGGSYYADTGYYGGCGWLYRRALASNSPYWWNRYYACAG